MERYFCSECGTPLVHKVHPAGFGSRTGEALFTLTFSCPNWKPFWGHRHTHNSLVGVFTSLDTVPSYFTAAELLDAFGIVIQG